MTTSICDSRVVSIACLTLLQSLIASCADKGREAEKYSPRIASADPGWELVWSDEFSGDALDRSRWTPEASCWGGGNNERQCYTDRPENIKVRDGFLHLEARKERFEGPTFPPEFGRSDTNVQEYTSGKVRTRGRASWRYGRFEVRAKPPAGQGAWPAVWMMPAGDEYGSWPRSGEIDILEAVNLGATCDVCDGGVGENRTISALHFGDFAPKNEFVDTRVALPDRVLPSDDFHVWAAEWNEREIRFFLDGREYFRVGRDQWNTASPLADGNASAPFDKPFYIMANLAVGGRLAEENNDKGFDAATFPATFLIDYIRVYQCASDMESGVACME